MVWLAVISSETDVASDISNRTTNVVEEPNSLALSNPSQQKETLETPKKKKEFPSNEDYSLTIAQIGYENDSQESVKDFIDASTCTVSDSEDFDETLINSNPNHECVNSQNFNCDAEEGKSETAGIGSLNYPHEHFMNAERIWVQNAEKDNLVEEIHISNVVPYRIADIETSTLDKMLTKRLKSWNMESNFLPESPTNSVIRRNAKTEEKNKRIYRISWRSLLDSKTKRLSKSFLNNSIASDKSCLEEATANDNTPADVNLSNYREVGIDIGDLEKNLPKNWKEAQDSWKAKRQPPKELEKINSEILNNQAQYLKKISETKDEVYEGKDNRRHSNVFDTAVIAPETSNNYTDVVKVRTHQGHFVVVAVDFGTTFSGYAFSFTRDPENIHMMRKWDGGDPGVINQKTPTCLLLNPEGKFHSFGFTARDFYHDMDPQETKNWLYFDKFKMSLHHTTSLSRETQIAAANGKNMPALTIFAHALRYFKDHALLELSDQSATKILNEDIRWVITVPAIWRQAAKQFMREAAYEAGIATPECPDQLLIALEPEAASIYCRKLKMNQLVPENYGQSRLSIFPEKLETNAENTNPIFKSEQEEVHSSGTRYMVVDCGGGTVDITVHEMIDKVGTLKELYKAIGGPFGSVGVDMEFEKLLKDIFSADFMDQFKANRPAGYVDLMIAFEARKRNSSPFKTNPLNISLPFSFIDFYRKYKGGSVENAIRKYGNKSIRWSSQGMLRLEPEAMFHLFKPVIKGIIEHIASVLAKLDVRTLQYLFLVGGFAESQILQQEVRNAFGSQLRVMIPQGVSLAILRGAVLYGLDPSIVSVRRSRLSYGVGVLNKFKRGIHPLDKLLVRDGQEWCKDVFDKFVVPDQSIGLGDTILRSYTPSNNKQTKIVLHIYCTENEKAKFVTDEGVRRCGTVSLELDPVDGANFNRREIQTRMIFGDTEIKVNALDMETQKYIQSYIDFLK